MDAKEQVELLGKLLLAAFCGAVIGWQRDRRRYVAGLRTMALVATGAALFTGVNQVYGQDRVTSNIVTGIGFLGAGIIFRDGSTVRGITTAATVWAVAAGSAAGRIPCAGASVDVALERVSGEAAARRRGVPAPPRPQEPSSRRSPPFTPALQIRDMVSWNSFQGWFTFSHTELSVLLTAVAGTYHIASASAMETALPAHRKAQVRCGE